MRLFSRYYFFAFYVLNSLSWFLFSYTQVDLNLTLNQSGLARDVQSFFQQIGFYNRPLSTAWLVSNLIISFLLYFIVIKPQSGLKSPKHLLVTAITGAVVMNFAYPAFSYDIFNYMFTAKTVLFYGRNPYEITPIQFAGFDAWLSFLRWTHLPSAYTPLWILLTLPFYILGFNKFLIILFNIKMLMTAAYLLCGYFIYKVARITGKDPVLTASIFLFNPLVYVESVISAHNDIVMMALALGAVYLWLNSKYSDLRAFIFLALSVAAKSMTIFLYPMFLFRWNIKSGLVLMLIALGIGIYMKEPLGWYVLWIVPFAAFWNTDPRVLFVLCGVSGAFLVRYIPLIYYGEYSDPMKFNRDILFFTVITLTIILAVIIHLLWSARTLKSRLNHNSLK